MKFEMEDQNKYSFPCLNLYVFYPIPVSPQPYIAQYYWQYVYLRLYF